MIRETGLVKQTLNSRGLVLIHAEVWEAERDGEIARGHMVLVDAVKDSKLRFRQKTENLKGSTWKYRFANFGILLQIGCNWKSSSFKITEKFCCMERKMKSFPIIWDPNFMARQEFLNYFIP